jgi:deoxyribose-phosphate aldolase
VGRYARKIMYTLIEKMDKSELAAHLDLANHHPDATPEAIKELCHQVKKYHFNAAFVNPYYVSLAKATVDGIKVGTVVAFPLGQEMRDIKVISAISAARAGADELDVQMNVGLFKAGKYQEVLREMEAVVDAAKSVRASVIVKFIIETGYLTEKEIKKASELVLTSGADFVKTCSGLGPRGATIKDVVMIRKAIGNKIRVKVAGGVGTYDEAVSFLEIGADRIGTSMAVEIIEEADRKAKNE